MSTLSRAFVLHVVPDGQITFEPVLVENHSEMPDDWRSVVIDMLLTGRINDARHMFRRSTDTLTETIEELPEGPTRETLSLPLFSTDTEAEAKVIRAMFCRLERPIAPSMQCRDATTREALTDRTRVYRLSRFNGTIPDLFRVQADMERAYARMKENR